MSECLGRRVLNFQTTMIKWNLYFASVFEPIEGACALKRFDVSMPIPTFLKRQPDRYTDELLHCKAGLANEVGLPFCIWPSRQSLEPSVIFVSSGAA